MPSLAPSSSSDAPVHIHHTPLCLFCALNCLRPYLSSHTVLLPSYLPRILGCRQLQHRVPCCCCSGCWMLGVCSLYSRVGSFCRCDCGARHQPTFCKARPTDRPMTDRPMTGRPFWCIRRLLLEFVSDAQHCTQTRACAQNHGSLSMCIHAY